MNDPTLMEESGAEPGGTVEEEGDFGVLVHLNTCDALTIGYVVELFKGKCN